VIDATRRRWARDGRVHIDSCPTVRTDRSGTWISAWLLAGDLAPIDADALSAALRDLPLWPGEVFRLLRQEGLAYAEIAQRLGLTVDEVRTYVAAALAHLDAALGDD
jgi:DNA-directed RNA polymerase specialized sigma24 family protein